VIPRKALRGGIQKSICNRLINFDHNFPQNGSKNKETALRTRSGYPHEGPSVVRVGGALQGYLADKKHPPAGGVHNLRVGGGG
jgi:hypothetical protein